MGKKIPYVEKCETCNKEMTINVDPNDYKAWQNGALIQSVMPYLTAEEREMLIFHACQECWDKMFPDEEDEPEGDLEDQLETLLKEGDIIDRQLYSQSGTQKK
jgi:hypothetical protein